MAWSNIRHPTGLTGDFDTTDQTVITKTRDCPLSVLRQIDDYATDLPTSLSTLRFAVLIERQRHRRITLDPNSDAPPPDHQNHPAEAPTSRDDNTAEV